MGGLGSLVEGIAGGEDEFGPEAAEVVVGAVLHGGVGFDPADDRFGFEFGDRAIDLKGNLFEGAQGVDGDSGIEFAVGGEECCVYGGTFVEGKEFGVWIHLEGRGTTHDL